MADLWLCLDTTVSAVSVALVEVSLPGQSTRRCGGLSCFVRRRLHDSTPMRADQIAPLLLQTILRDLPSFPVAVALAVGPGSFVGARVGVGLVQALALAHPQLRLHRVDTLIGLGTTDGQKSLAARRWIVMPMGAQSILITRWQQGVGPHDLSRVALDEVKSLVGTDRVVVGGGLGAARKVARAMDRDSVDAVYDSVDVGLLPELADPVSWQNLTPQDIPQGATFPLAKTGGIR